MTPMCSIRDEVDGLGPADIAMSQLDRDRRSQPLVVTSTPAQRGGKPAAALLGGGLTGLIEIGQTVTTGAPR